MAVWIVRLFGEPVIVHHLPADKSLKRKGGEHVQTKAQSSNLYHDVALRRKVVEDVALSKGSKGEEAGECHYEAGYKRDKGAVMRYSREAVDCRGPKRSIN